MNLCTWSTYLLHVELMSNESYHVELMSNESYHMELILEFMELLHLFWSSWSYVGICKLVHLVDLFASNSFKLRWACISAYIDVSWRLLLSFGLLETVSRLCRAMEDGVSGLPRHQPWSVSLSCRLPWRVWLAAPLVEARQTLGQTARNTCLT